MIIITGASGKLGRLVVQNLLTRVSPAEIGISVRDAGKVADFAAQGVRVVEANFDRETSLIDAFAGGHTLLLVSSNAAAYGGDTLMQHRNAIAAAKAAGIERIFYTAQVATSPASHVSFGLSHYATERMLDASGLKWTSLRHGFYAASGLHMIGEALTSGTLRTPADGPVAWTTHEDLAEADAALLTGAEQFDGPVNLTANAQYDFSQLAEIASRLGRPVVRTLVDDAAFATALDSRFSPQQVGFMMGFYRAARSGEFAATDTALARLLGREPTSMEQALEQRLRAEPVLTQR